MTAVKTYTQKATVSKTKRSRSVDRKRQVKLDGQPGEADGVTEGRGRGTVTKIAR